MTPLVITVLLCSLGFVPVFWLLRRFGFDSAAEHSVSVMTLAVLTLISPATAAVALAAAFAAPLAMSLGDRIGYRGSITVLWSCAMMSILFGSRRLDLIPWIGVAYFTLRHMHVVFDWWVGRLSTPDVAPYIHYQLFLPVMIAGPINRYPQFRRQVGRRRWDAGRFYCGAERALFGSAQAIFLGDYLASRLLLAIERVTVEWSDFYSECLISAVEWGQLYLIFSGVNAAAIGLSSMLGIRIEENFNQPWKARNLIDFWSRWHITLSSWCRDYVFKPVTALTRSPAIGVLLAMVAIGLWHGTSLYFVLWGVWQALGIILTRLIMRSYEAADLTKSQRAVIRRLMTVMGPLLVLFWLSLASPLIQRILDLLFR